MREENGGKSCRRRGGLSIRMTNENKEETKKDTRSMRKKTKTPRPKTISLKPASQQEQRNH